MDFVGRRVDLHGLYPDEVDHVLSPVIENAFRSGQTELTIIHGKGEGVLRQAVQRVLSRQRHLILSVQRGEEVMAGGEGWIRISLRYKDIKRVTLKPLVSKPVVSKPLKKMPAEIPAIAPDLSPVIEKRAFGRVKYLRRMQRRTEAK